MLLKKAQTHTHTSNSNLSYHLHSKLKEDSLTVVFTSKQEDWNELVVILYPRPKTGAPPMT